MAETVNEKILHGQIRRAVDIERYKAGLSTQMIRLLNKSEDRLIDEIAGRIVKIEERGFDLGPDTTSRLNAVLNAVQKNREEIYKTFDDQLSLDLTDFADHEVDFQIKAADNAGIIADFIRPPVPAIAAIVTKQPFRGGLLKDWASSLGEAESKKIRTVLQNGMVEGKTVDQMVKEIRGTKSAQYSDGILDIGRRDAQAVVLTSVSHVQNRARMQLFEENEDIIAELQYRATLDSKTTILCASRDGNLYPLGKAPILPAHWRCRSILIAFYRADKVGLRSGEFGPLPASMTYSDFLRKQSNDYQDNVLGPERAKLFRSGTDLEKFIDKSGETYTLTELKARKA